MSLFLIFHYGHIVETKNKEAKLNGVDKVQICYSVELIEDPDIYPHTYGQFFFIKKQKRNNGKKKTSLTTVAGIPGYLYVEECT